jgi:hypothetical protein
MIQVVVSIDPGGPYQQQQIRVLLSVVGQGGELGALAGDTLGDFRTHRGGRIGGTRQQRREWDGFAFGMEDDGVGGAFDVNGPAIFAAAALIGHHGEHFLLALPRRFQIFQGLFHLQQIECHAPQRLARLLRLLGRLLRARTQRPQQLFFGLEPVAFALHFAVQVRGRVLFVVQASGDLLELFADFTHL